MAIDDDGVKDDLVTELSAKNPDAPEVEVVPDPDPEDPNLVPLNVLTTKHTETGDTSIPPAPETLAFSMAEDRYVVVDGEDSPEAPSKQTSDNE